MSLLSDVLTRGKVAPVPAAPGRARFDSDYKKYAKVRRPRDNFKKSRRNQRQSSIGQALAGIIGGEQGKKSKLRTQSSISGSLGGLSQLGV